MNLYIDESGNTGAVLFQKSKPNYQHQPYYVIAGLMLDEQQNKDLELFVNSLVSKYRIKATELKAKSIYEKKHKFYVDLVAYLLQFELPIMIELMDKQYYINQHLVDYVFIPHYSADITNELLEFKKMTASKISSYITPEIYENFIETVNSFTHESLLAFYDALILHLKTFSNPTANLLIKSTEETKKDYLKNREEFGGDVIAKYLPIPDKNPHGRDLFLLPNFNAFSNLVARAELFNKSNNFNIIHDEQDQFEIIFHSALDQLKKQKTNIFIKGTEIEKLANFDVSNHVTLKFADSKNVIALQVADLLAGMVMRFWSDWIKKNDRYKKYCNIVEDLINLEKPLGINLVVPSYV